MSDPASTPKPASSWLSSLLGGGSNSRRHLLWGGVALAGAAGVAALLWWRRKGGALSVDHDPAEELQAPHLALHYFDNISWHKVQNAARDVYHKFINSHGTEFLKEDALLVTLGEVHQELAGKMPSNGDWPLPPTQEMIEEALEILPREAGSKSVSRPEFEQLVMLVRGIQSKRAHKELEEASSSS